MEALSSLLPVIVGGAIGVIGSICGGVLLHLLKVRTEQRTHRRDKLEQLVSLAYQCRHWIQTNSLAELSGQPINNEMLPSADMRMISLLYWPELKEEVADLNNYIVAYHIWAIKQGFRRKQQGMLGSEALQEHDKRAMKVRELLGKLEEKAEAVASRQI